MSACANCARELRPEWKFCVYCGTPTGVTAARPEAADDPVPAPAPAPDAPEDATVLVSASSRSVEAPAPAPAPAPAVIAEHPATLVVAPPVVDAPPPTALRTRSRSRSRVAGPARSSRINALAVVALVLGCLASPLAALFGHIALAQIAASGERGRLPALIAVVLGYASLAFIVGLVAVYLITNA
jgi:hypothetical protein